MSSAGQAVGGIVGAAIGFFVPGVGLAISANSAVGVGCLLLPPQQADGEESDPPESDDRNGQ